ncbi:MAG TPA: PQQ-binding-like beta-propeller repeat protein [Planctomycetaceae bacterium]|nr:PQQ-binding-like beta-propeller repeat protein [Planctomycetaceae bacterium]
MRKLMFLGGVAAALLATAGPAHAQRNALASPLPSQAQLNRYNLTRAWWGNAVMNSTRDKLLYLTLDDEILLAQSSSGIVTAFNSETGRKLWSAQLGSTDEGSLPATVNDDSFLIANGLDLYCLEKRNGEIRWRLRLPRLPTTRPTADDQTVYVGSIDGSMTAFDLRKIAQLYGDNLLPQWSHYTLKWRFRTSAEITVPAIMSGKYVLFASTNGSLYSVTNEERKLVFQFETNAPVSAPLARWRDTVLLASEDSRLYALDVNTGAIRWQFVTGLRISDAPRVIENELYLTPNLGGIYRLNPADGTQQWPGPQTRAVNFVGANPVNVFATDKNGNLLVLSRENGAVQGSIPMDRFNILLPNDRNDRLYMGTTGGMIICMRERDREYPIYYKYPERQPLLPEFASDNEEEGAAEMPEEGAPAEEQ